MPTTPVAGIPVSRACIGGVRISVASRRELELHTVDHAGEFKHALVLVRRIDGSNRVATDLKWFQTMPDEGPAELPFAGRFAIDRQPDGPAPRFRSVRRELRFELHLPRRNLNRSRDAGVRN